MNYNTVAVTTYKTSDGMLFECDRKAEEHQEDIIGELLDCLLPHDDRGNVTMTDRHNILMKQLKSKDLVNNINALHHALNFHKEYE